MNRITKDELGEDLWNLITEDWQEFTSDEPRKYATRYVKVLYVIDETVTDNADLWGYWESETCIWTDEHGLDMKPEELYRVELVEVVTHVYKRVK